LVSSPFTMQPLLFFFYGVILFSGLLSFFYGIILFSGIAVVVPVATQPKGRSFIVDQVLQRDFVPHGPTALSKAYRKFNITPTNFGLDALDFEPVTANSQEAETSQGTSYPSKEGSVTATSFLGDAMFISPVTIGGQHFMMQFDTGSADL
jgi:hypothetical protein